MHITQAIHLNGNLGFGEAWFTWLWDCNFSSYFVWQLQTISVTLLAFTMLGKDGNVLTPSGFIDSL